jgi:hypothetical protein
MNIRITLPRPPKRTKSNGRSRVIYDLAPGFGALENGRRGSLWEVRRRIPTRPRGPLVFSARRKGDCKVAMSQRLREQWEAHGRLSQLVIRAVDGKVQEERTYGRDPRRHRG